MKKEIIIGVIVGVVILAGAGWYFYVSNGVNQSGQIPPVTTVQNDLPGQKTLQIVSNASRATYELNEELQGKPTHVVGSTNQVTGNIVLKTTSPQTIAIGPVYIDASTFRTDIPNRDENVQELILKSNQRANRFITFTTTNITGVPKTIEMDKDFPVTITGDMTILGITKPVTFKGVANLSNDTVLKINASTVVTYGDFGVVVPNFSFLTNVDKTVKLNISLVAK